MFDRVFARLHLTCKDVGLAHRSQLRLTQVWLSAIGRGTVGAVFVVPGLEASGRSIIKPLASRAKRAAFLF